VEKRKSVGWNFPLYFTSILLGLYILILILIDSFIHTYTLCTTLFVHSWPCAVRCPFDIIYYTPSSSLCLFIFIVLLKSFFTSHSFIHSLEAVKWHWTWCYYVLVFTSLPSLLLLLLKIHTGSSTGMLPMVTFIHLVFANRYIFIYVSTLTFILIPYHFDWLIDSWTR